MDEAIVFAESGRRGGRRTVHDGVPTTGSEARCRSPSLRDLVPPGRHRVRAGERRPYSRVDQ
ncbi:hypothetical protein [Nocardiopsis halotolerans]|uniref:hypothetical protein n=1 Tax=Nocardiopsis halotolerans TaxID=124252 RepID=UPI00034DC60E|nr:hypothetical protein [Nocardiopsis halotolerans]